MGREKYWGRATRKEERENPGCMSGVLQFFDFHHSQFTLHQPCFKPNSILQEDLKILRGVEAPRNSLETKENPLIGEASLSSTMKEEDLNIPMGIRLEVKRDTAPTEEISSEISSSPGTKTPNLVARLMGLDLLPESISPSSSSSIHARLNSRGKPHQIQLQERNSSASRRENRCRHTLQTRSIITTNSNNFMESEVRYEITRCHSLPETPRISSARRSDVVDPRLSLQINKENLITTEEFNYFDRVSKVSVSSRILRKKDWRLDDENRSPSQYARQIVKQVRESVSRKVGLDITNSTRNRAIDGDSFLAKSKKTRRLGDESSPGKHSTSSCSPRLRFLEPKSKPVSEKPAHDQNSHSPKPSSKPRPLSLSPPPLPLLAPLLSSTFACSANQPQQLNASTKPSSQQLQQQATNKCKKANSERFTQRLKKPRPIPEKVRNMREEAFVHAASTAKAKANLLLDKKIKNKTPLSNDLLNIATVPSSTQTQSKAVQASKPSSQLSSCTSRTYKHETMQELVNRDNNNSGGGAEFRYVNGILKRTGINSDTLVSFTKWYSPSHPLDPSIFHNLEHSFSDIPTTTSNSDCGATTNKDEEEDYYFGSLKHRCNRKLLFNLVDEILVDILKPYLKLKPWLLFFFFFSSSFEKMGPNHMMIGTQLLHRLWKQIRSFPSSDCQIQQDIDALIDKDLPEANIRMLPIFEETESLAFEIERVILDSLIHETTALLTVDDGDDVRTIVDGFRTETAVQ